MSGLTLQRARTEARRLALAHRVDIAIGLQRNDVTGADEYGYCPLAAIGPAFVHTVLERATPTGAVRPVAFPGAAR